MSSRVSSARLIGRTAELRALGAALADARASRPSLALVAGESGVGKTRLLDALAERAGADGVAVLRGECVSLGDGELPYAPIAGALRPLARRRDPILDGLPAGVRRTLATLVPGLGPAVADGEPRRAPITDGDGDRAALYEALLGLLDVVAGERGLVLLVEDVHWADAATRGFLSFLSRGLDAERVLVVATYRPDELHRRHPLRPLLADLERHPSTLRVDVPRLHRDELAELLTEVRGDPPDEALLERLWNRGEGNPLYTEELLAAGLDGRGAPPATVTDALRLRVERLPDDAQRVARLVALGRAVDHVVLATAAGLPESDLHVALRSAVDEHVLVTDADDRYAFRHALLGEALEDDVLPGEREGLHRALAAALSAHPAEPGATVQRAARIAHHHAAAGDRDAAFSSALRAAEAARCIHADVDAARLFDRALELWDRVADPEGTAGETRADLLRRAGRSHRVAGGFVRSEALLRSALERCGDGSDRESRRRRAEVLLDLAAVLWQLGRQEEAIGRSGEALELLEDEESGLVRARILAWRAKRRMLQGRHREAIAAAEATLPLAVALGDHSEGDVRNALGTSLMAVGRTAEGRAELLSALRIARDDDRPGDIASAHVNHADALHLVGRSREALRMMAEAKDELEHVGRNRGRRDLWVVLGIGEFAFAAGDWELARRQFDASDRGLGARGLAYLLLRRALMALVDGRDDAAAAALERAAPLLESVIEPQFLAPYGAAAGELARRRGDLDTARAAVEQAIDRIEYRTDDGARLAEPSSVGVALEADAALRARDRGEDPSSALARAATHVERIRAAAHPYRPVEVATLADAEADLLRGRGEDAGPAFAAAADAWAAVDRPYPRALSLLREAEARVVSGDRAGASRAASEAARTARRLDAPWLRDQLDALASRGRLTLDAPEDRRGQGGRTHPSSEADDRGGETDRKDGGPADDRAAAAADQQHAFDLTPRELQVLALVASGATNREVGATLFMAEKTASVHVSRILAKLGVRSRTEAAAVAHRQGLAGPAADAGRDPGG